MLSADVPESRRSFDIDDRERLPIGLTEGIRDRLVQSAELNTERLAIADVSRERYAMGDASRERVSVDRDRAAQVDVIRSGSVEPNRIADYEGPAGKSSSGQASEISIAKILSTSINFDNPSVKQALDNLMSGGPSLFRSVSDAVGQKVAGKYPEGDSRF
jgi:hypothetical protein